MKTREQIYGNEASGLLRAITMYGALTKKQAERLYPGKTSKIDTLLSRLVSQGRIFYNHHAERYYAQPDGDGKYDAAMAAAVWVLLDFVDKVEYHCAGDYPVKLGFFADGELYEVIYVAAEQEAIVNHALKSREETSKYIVIVDRPEQIPLLDIEHTTGYCTVAVDGAVSYYKTA